MPQGGASAVLEPQRSVQATAAQTEARRDWIGSLVPHDGVLCATHSIAYCACFIWAIGRFIQRICDAMTPTDSVQISSHISVCTNTRARISQLHLVAKNESRAIERLGTTPLGHATATRERGTAMGLIFPGNERPVEAALAGLFCQLAWGGRNRRLAAFR